MSADVGTESRLALLSSTMNLYDLAAPQQRDGHDNLSCRDLEHDVTFEEALRTQSQGARQIIDASSCDARILTLPMMFETVLTVMEDA